jgi:hemoglobin-like flavoprotein
VVQQSWKTFQGGSDATTVGVVVFRRFLKRSPGFLQLFPFRDQPLETLFLNAKVRLHGKLFMDTLSRTIALLSDDKALKSSLFDLGSRHADLYRVKTGHYEAMGKALLESLEQSLGPNGWDEETQESWEETWAHITKLMQAGAGSRDVSHRGDGSVRGRDLSNRGRKSPRKPSVTRNS